MLDMNDAAPQRDNELIPDGTFAKVTLTIQHGGVDGSSDTDRGLLTMSKSPGSDVRLLNCEFTVVEGPHAKRKFWQSFTVAGGKLDEKGQSIGWNISKGVFRAMIDSALGLNPDDMSEAAKAKRVLRGLSDLDGITFVAKIKIEPSNNPQWSDKNRLDYVVLPTAPQWQKIMSGETVPAQPGARRSTTAKSAPAQPQPAWQQNAPTPAAAKQADKPAAKSDMPPWLNG